MKSRPDKKILIFVCIVTALLLASGNVYAAGQASTSYMITEDVISGGGGFGGSVTYMIQTTVGQASPIGNASSLTYSNHAGFWHFFVTIGDLNGDGFVDLVDVIYGLQVMTDMDAGQLYKKADVDGDGKIGMAEIVYILQKVGGVR